MMKEIETMHRPSPSSRPARDRRLLARARGALAALATLGFVAFLPAAGAGATEIQRVTTPGGIEVWLVEDHTVPIVAVEFAFRGGASQDPEGKTGLTNLLSTTLDEGAGDLDSRAFQGRLEDLAMRLSYDAGRDAFYGSLRTLAPNASDAFEMLRLSLNEPRFDAEPVERMKAQIISRLRRNATDPDHIANRETAALVFPGHPYGLPVDGTEDSVAALTPEDLGAQHRKLFSRSTLKIAVVGAIDAQTLTPLVDAAFGALPEATELTPVADIEPRSNVTKAIELDVPQTSIRFTLPGMKRKDPDFITAYVMNHILGGGSFSSWLYEEVREKRGLAYSVGSYLIPFDHAGLLMGMTGTRADRAQETVDIIDAQLKRMAEEGPTEEELAKAKAFLTGSYALRFDTSNKIANQLVGIQLDDLGIDYIEKRNSLIEAVTLEDVKRIARRLLGGVSPAVVTVGPSAS